VPERSVSLREAARFWGQLGWVSFGGPAGQIALLHETLVERRRWLSERRFLHALNYCMLLPGPEAIQLATYLGWLMHGNAGGPIAGGLFLLPSVGVLLALSMIYALWGQWPVLVAVFWALKPAAMAARKGVARVRRPTFQAACTTIATTAGLSAQNTATNTGHCPQRA
jgi:chromate transporter